MMYNIAYKYRSILYSFVLSLVLLTGCERAGDEITLSADVVGGISLVASQSDESTTRVENNIWESTDFIGLSTLDESGAESEDVNMCYMVESNGTMTNTDEDYDISVINSKSYYAYYPYDKSIDNDIKSVDLSSQSTMSEAQFKSLDLMWAKQESISGYQPTVYLIFEKQMVHIDVTLFIYGNAFDDSSGITLSGVYSTGDFNIKSGEMTPTSAKGDLKLRVTDTLSLSDGSTIVHAEGYMLPMSSSTIKFSYTSGTNNNASCIMSSGSLVAGNNYNFVITESIESHTLSQIDESNFPSGNFWVISDSGSVVSSQFGGLRSALETQAASLSEVSLLFLNLTALPSGALKGCTALESLSMPQVTTVNSYAFADCSSLTDLYAPCLEYVAGYAFSGCESLAISSLGSVNMVGDSAFKGCSSLVEIEAESVESIADNAFANCSNMKVCQLPNITWVGSGVFAGCDNLVEINLGEESETGITNLKSGWVDASQAGSIQLIISTILPSGVSVSGNTLSYADGSSDTFGSVENQSLTLSSFDGDYVPDYDTWIIMDTGADSSAIDSSDFAGLRSALLSKKSVTLIFPNLQTLPSEALKSTPNFSSIYLTSVTSIGEDALSGASSLRSVVLGSSGGAISSIDSGWLTTTESELIDLSIYSSLPSGVSISDNLLGFTASGTTSYTYFKTINGTGLLLHSFQKFLSDSSSLPNSTEWYITESGTPSYTEFDDLQSVLKNVKSDITLIFAELEALPRTALDGTENLYKVSLPKATRIYYNALSECTSLQIVDAPCVTTVSDSAFARSTNLTSVSLPSAMVVGSSLFSYSMQMESIDLGSEAYVSSYDTDCFESMYLLSTKLIICGQDKFTSDMSITNGNTLNFAPSQSSGSNINFGNSYTFSEIEEK